jgi:hypothetical protein
MSLRKVHLFWVNNEGSALVEGAVVVPLLIIFLSGVFEYSWLFYQQHLISIGLRDAVAYLARLPDPCNPASRTWLAAQEYARKLATRGSTEGVAPRVRGWTAEMVKPHCTKVDNPVGANGLRKYRGSSVYVVTMSTEFNYQPLGFFDLLRLRPPVISVSHSERAIELR